jgi:hypothetical protein
MGGPILRFYVGGDLLRYSCNVDWVTAYATAALANVAVGQGTLRQIVAGARDGSREARARSSEPLLGSLRAAIPDGLSIRAADLSAGRGLTWRDNGAPYTASFETGRMRLWSGFGTKRNGLGAHGTSGGEGRPAVPASS